MVLSSGSGPRLDLPLVLGLPLQLKLAVSGVVLSQGAKKEILPLPPLGLDSLLELWVQPQGRLFLGTLPGKRELCPSSLAHHWKMLKEREKIGRGTFLGERNLWDGQRTGHTRGEGNRRQWEEVLSNT